ncbi:hypothetical protein B0J18DRAFT_93981 [Chaetomium sp. MPI-SDFR-AT-0129]|nr:hypothetical protein B0J18DRAFT_93981 [Chaetomium sp. MPI-SDFR-AT-0129]
MFRSTLRRLRPPQLADNLPAHLTNLQLPARAGAEVGLTGNQPHFMVCDKVIKFRKQHKVFLPFGLRTVPGHPLKCPVRVTFTSAHVFSFYHIKYLGPCEHALTQMLLDEYAEKKRARSLWVYAQAASVTDGSKAVVRVTSERIVRTATLKALNAAGYDSTGSRLDGTGNLLYGTMRVLVLEPKAAVNMKFETLVELLLSVFRKGVPGLRVFQDPEDESLTPSESESAA